MDTEHQLHKPYLNICSVTFQYNVSTWCYIRGTHPCAVVQVFPNNVQNTTHTSAEEEKARNQLQEGAKQT